MTRRNRAIETADTLPAPAEGAGRPGRASPRVRVPERRAGAKALDGVVLAPLPGESPAETLARVTAKQPKRGRKPPSDRKPVAKARRDAPVPVDARNLVAFVVPVVTANESNGSHQNWRAVQARRTHIGDETSRAIKQAGSAPPAPPLEVIITRHSAGELDDDGLRSAGKKIRDTVAKWLGVDDKKRELVAYEYGQEKCAQGIGWVTVEIRRGVAYESLTKRLVELDANVSELEARITALEARRVAG